MQCWGDAVKDDRFADKVLMPGFVEGHSHIMEGGIWPYTYVGYFDRVSPEGGTVAGLRSNDEVVARLRAGSAETGGEWCGARVGKYVYVPVVDVSLKQKIKQEPEPALADL